MRRQHLLGERGAAAVETEQEHRVRASVRASRAVRRKPFTRAVPPLLRQVRRQAPSVVAGPRGTAQGARPRREFERARMGAATIVQAREFRQRGGVPARIGVREHRFKQALGSVWFTLPRSGLRLQQARMAVVGREFARPARRAARTLEVVQPQQGVGLQTQRTRVAGTLAQCAFDGRERGTKGEQRLQLLRDIEQRARQACAPLAAAREQLGRANELCLGLAPAPQSRQAMAASRARHGRTRDMAQCALETRERGLPLRLRDTAPRLRDRVLVVQLFDTHGHHVIVRARLIGGTVTFGRATFRRATSGHIRLTDSARQHPP